jgi:thiosulfate/3-mercaptopyruvate sulfurtransferase
MPGTGELYQRNSNMAHDPLVTTDWLQEHLRDPGLRVVDMRGYVTTRPVEPGVEDATYRGAYEEYRAGHIPGAVYVDWTTDIVDPADPVPAQIAPADRFAEAMAVRGIGDATHVVAVDHMGGQFATRLWWALTYYGHDAVSVLDGGWNRWVEEGRAVEAGDVVVPRAEFHPRPWPERRATAEQVLGQLGRDGLQLLDARDAGQYTGARRRGPRGGHIPGALNVPRELFFAEGGGFLPLDEIGRRLAGRGVVVDRPTIAYCNGGVAATVVLFNLARLGASSLTNYDGSWNEWGPRLDLPAKT